MSLRYRQQIRPHYHEFIALGLSRYAEHPATKAGLALADQLLRYKASHEFTALLAIERLMNTLRDHGVTARDLVVRVAEFHAYFDGRPDAVRAQREEDFAIARGIVHLIAWKGSGRTIGSKVLQHLGPLIREHCGLFCMRLVARLKEDLEKQAELKKVAASL